jgi:hypothetical protein
LIFDWRTSSGAGRLRPVRADPASHEHKRSKSGRHCQHTHRTQSERAPPEEPVSTRVQPGWLARQRLDLGHDTGIEGRIDAHRFPE